MDLVKGLAVSIVLGGLLLSAILWVMQSTGELWWLYAWLAISGFSLLTAWLYPVLLAPLFNKFTPLPDGVLKEKIHSLAAKLDFKTDGLFVMNASVRSSHGNAYFTGVFGKKRIVLFDTLVDSMSEDEVVAVLAHELGHFKLHHVRTALMRSFFITGIVFYLFSLVKPMIEIYSDFYFLQSSNYAALFIFSLFFGIIGFILQPMETWLSRRNEFAADRFAIDNIQDYSLLSSALLKLRKKSSSVPLSHPLYSSFYYSHPPMIERINAMKSAAQA